MTEYTARAPTEASTTKVCEHSTGWNNPYDKTYNSMLDSVCYNQATDFTRSFRERKTTQQFGEIDGCATTCSLKLCMKRSKEGGTTENGLSLKANHSRLDFRNASDQACLHSNKSFEDRRLTTVQADVLTRYRAGNSSEYPRS